MNLGFFKLPLLILFSTLLTSLVALFLMLPIPYFAVITCYILVVLFNEEIHSYSMQRVTGAFIALFFVELFLQLSPQYESVRLVFYALLLLVLLYFHITHVLPHAMIFAIILIGFVIVSELTVGTQWVLAQGKDWVFQVVIGAAAAVFSTLLFNLRRFSRSAVLTLFSNMANSVKTLRKQPKPQLGFNRLAFLQALRLLLIIFLLVLINRVFDWQAYSAEAVIAIAVIATELNNDHSAGHRKLWQLIIGTVIGVIIGRLFSHFLSHTNSPWHWLIILELSLFLLAVCAQFFKRYLYLIVQIGIVLIIMLVTPNAPEDSVLALQRAIGFIEGGLLSLVVILLSDYIIRRKTISDPDE